MFGKITILELSVGMKNIKTIKYMIDNGAKIEPHQLCFGIHHGNVTKLYLRAGESINNCWATLCLLSCYNTLFIYGWDPYMFNRMVSVENSHDNRRKLMFNTYTPEI
jgi:hypothetical protein